MVDDELNWKLFCSKRCSKCGQISPDLVDTLCDNCGHRLVLQVSSGDLKKYLEEKYEPTINHELNMKEVLAELFPKDLFEYITFSCLHFLLSAGLVELRNWQEKLEDLHVYAGKSPEEKRVLAQILQDLHHLLEEYSDKLQSSLQDVWKKMQSSPIKQKLEEFTQVWQKSQEFLGSKISPQLVGKIQEGLEEKLTPVETSAKVIEHAYPVLKALLFDLLTQLQYQSNTKINQAILRSLKEMQFILSLLPQMLQGRDYPQQTIAVYNINTILSMGG